MKRHGSLWPQLISFPNLLAAFEKAQQRKRRRPDVAAFEFNLEHELCRLHEELRDRTYRPGSYRTFHLRDPKPRLISAAPFRDRVVHHALCRILEPIYERTFIADSYACRPGKGTHAAVDRFTQFARRCRHVLKCDVQKYFPSIDHLLLKEQVRRKIKDDGVLWLVDTILDHANDQEPVLTLYPGDDLFTLCTRRRGLPLGNQTSQFLANVYLNPLDHFVKEVLRARCYIRYVDDFVLLHDDRGWLVEARERCRDFLAGLRLRLHPNKAVISRVADGTRFLGYRVFPTHRLLPRANVTNMKRRLRQLQWQMLRGWLRVPEVCQRISGWIGHAQEANTLGLRKWLLGPMKNYWRVQQAFQVGG